MNFTEPIGVRIQQWLNEYTSREHNKTVVEQAAALLKPYIEYDPRYSDPLLLQQASALGRTSNKFPNNNKINAATDETWATLNKRPLAFLESPPARMHPLAMELSNIEHIRDPKSGEQVLVVFTEDEGEWFFGLKFGLSVRYLDWGYIPEIAVRHSVSDWQKSHPHVFSGREFSRSVMAREILRERILILKECRPHMRHHRK